MKVISLSDEQYDLVQRALTRAGENIRRINPNIGRLCSDASKALQDGIQSEIEEEDPVEEHLQELDELEKAADTEAENARAEALKKADDEAAKEPAGSEDS